MRLAGYTKYFACLDGVQHNLQVVGGSPVYKTAMDHQKVEKLHITRILKYFHCDTFFPKIDLEEWELTEDVDVPSGMQMENGIQYKFEVYRRRPR